MVSLQPLSVFGLRADVRGNIHFTPKQEVVYPVAEVLTIHDYRTNRQKFLRLAEHSTADILCMSPNKKLLAVSERQNDRCSINIYDMVTLKRRKTLHFPTDVTTPVAESLAFNHDSKGIAVLSHEPDAFLTVFYFDKAETVISGRVASGNQKNMLARFVSCNLSDTGLVAVCGEYTFKLMSRQEKTFTCIGTMTGDKRKFTSIIWLTPDVLVAGTSDNQLVFVEGGDLKVVYPAELMETIDLGKSKEDEYEAIDKLVAAHGQIEPQDVNCLTLYAKGFAYAVKNVLHVFEKEGQYKFAKKTRITVPVDMFADHLFNIQNVAINTQMDTVIVTAAHSQIYIGMLVVPETLKVKDLEFGRLGEPLHIDGVVDMSVCSWKPILMTAAKDQTIRIWNYESGKVELVKKFQVDLTSIALHPSGIFVAVGFNDQLRLMAIMLDDLKLIKTFNFPKCRSAEFAHEGHLLACAYEDLISVVAVFSFETILTLKGHNGIVRCVRWSPEDEYVVSAGEEGAVYQWNAKTGERANECVQKGTEYRELAVTRNVGATYAVSDTGLMRVIANSEIVRELRMRENATGNANGDNAVAAGAVDAVTSMAMSRSEVVMFVGTAGGKLLSVQFPLNEAGGGSCHNYRFFAKAVTRMRIVYNDMLLATASADGTLAIWTITNNEGRVAPMNADLGQCQDVMIPRRTLIDKINTIASLELRIQQQIAEFQYQMKQGAASHSEAIRDIHTGYCGAIEDLKHKNEEMQNQHVEEFNIVTENIAEMKDDQAKALMALEKDFHEKIIIEFEKSAKVKTQMDEMREDYECKLRRSAGCLQNTIEALETDFKKQLHERQELIRQLMQEMDSKKVEFAEFCKQVDIDGDRKLVETKLSYEQRLKDENDAMLKWRAEAGVLNKKYHNVSHNCDELEKEKAVLLAEHHKTRGVIRGFEKDVAELKKEIKDRDVTIRDKEKRLSDLLKKNQELEKYKLVLNHKIVELKAQIEPREREIKEKKDQIVDMEKELEGLELNNQQLELQLSELKDKYISIDKELKLERSRCRASRTQVERICGDIFQLSGYVQSPIGDLKTEVKKLFHRYADDKALRKSLEQDSDVVNEFLRQREHLERLLESYRQKDKKVETNSNGKLIMENVKLLGELNAVRVELKDVQRRAYHMESILGISGKYVPTAVAREKLAKACANFDEIEQRHHEEVDKLNDSIGSLRRQIQEMLSQFKDIGMERYMEMMKNDEQ